jgi:hypothetical protein
MPTPEGSNHHSHENPTSFMTPEGSNIPLFHQRLPLLSEPSICSPSPSPASALRAKSRREVEENSFFPKTLSYIKENFHTLYTFFFKYIFAIKIHFKNIQSRIFDAPQ